MHFLGEGGDGRGIFAYSLVGSHLNMLRFASLVWWPSYEHDYSFDTYSSATSLDVGSLLADDFFLGLRSHTLSDARLADGLSFYSAGPDSFRFDDVHPLLARQSVSQMWPELTRSYVLFSDANSGAVSVFLGFPEAV